LSDSSVHKTHYPSLRQRLTELEHIRAELQQSEAALREQELELRRRIDAVPQHVFVLGPDGHNHYVNQVGLAYTGLSLEESLAKNALVRIYHPEDEERVRNARQKAISQGVPLEAEARIRDADGRYRWFLIRINLLFDEHGRILRWYGTRTDIDDRKRAEEILHRLNRELRAISNCNQRLLHATDEQDLLREICRIVCQEAGYRMAWVGYADDYGAKSVRPVVWSGAEEGYLTNLGITWADTERRRSPTGTAIGSGKTCCIQDFATDPGLVP